MYTTRAMSSGRAKRTLAYAKDVLTQEARAISALTSGKCTSPTLKDVVMCS